MSQVSKGRVVGLAIGLAVGVLDTAVLNLHWFVSGGLAVIWALCTGLWIGISVRSVKTLDSRIETISCARWGASIGFLLLAVPAWLLFSSRGYEFETTGISGFSKLLLPWIALITMLFVGEDFTYYKVLSSIFERGSKVDES